MKQGIIFLIVVAFAVSAGANLAAAASDKCVVVESEGNKIVLECRKETSRFKEGDGVKIKSVRKSSGVEGC